MVYYNQLFWFPLCECFLYFKRFSFYVMDQNSIPFAHFKDKQTKASKHNCTQMFPIDDKLIPFNLILQKKEVPLEKLLSC